MSHPNLCCHCFDLIMPGEHAVIDGELWDVHQQCHDEDQMRLSDSNGDSGE